ncbi:anti-sigma regulatory factor [Paenibacillus rhizovicinus]|uniref:Anti-sigma regulatory factor n=1 Tax=Paenibacillus rhizovicinus TaxID=2704463 RepID=A0A6C0P482_9BACL|nr:anti-sigma regulatory factor [Paenibacillus rhizovicinus]QHW33299.1 anti-sigma regulatory factor [Paenibacillus rhizovicinus]
MEIFQIQEKSDAIQARHRGREIAKTIGFSLVDQTVIAYTISELALKLLSISAKGHMTIRPVSLYKGDSASGIEVRLFDHFKGPNRIHLQWMEKMTDSMELSHDQMRGTMITFHKWVHAPLRIDSPICAAGEE